MFRKEELADSMNVLLAMENHSLFYDILVVQRAIFVFSKRVMLAVMLAVMPAIYVLGIGANLSLIIQLQTVSIEDVTENEGQ